VQRCQCGLLSGLVLTILRRDRAASCGRRLALSSRVAVHGDSEMFMLVLNVDEGDTSRLFTDDVMASSETIGLLGNVLVHNLLVELDAIHPGIAHRVINSTYQSLKAAHGPNQADLIEALRPSLDAHGIE